MNVPEISVLTLNIHKGFSMGRLRFTLESIRNCLRESKATVVFLQEVVGEHTQHEKNIAAWPPGNQLEFLADSVWPHNAYGKNAIYEQGHHGNAILSAIPFKDWHNLDVSLLNISQRGVLHGVTEDGLHLLCAHLGLFEAERKIQTRRLVEYIHNNIPDHAPMILAGDFNDWRRSCHAILLKELDIQEAFQKYNLKLARTFPAVRPMLQMDRIYLRGFHVKSCKIMNNSQWRKISDHSALLATIRPHI
jgi:endonuclease/exonuclease/phosphatase family metal-dependent hydrolase